MEKFVSDLLKSADLTVLTKKHVRVEYKTHVGRDLSPEEKSKINGLVYQFVAENAAEQRKQTPNSSPGVPGDSPGNKENHLDNKKNGKIIVKGHVFDKKEMKISARQDQQLNQSPKKPPSKRPNDKSVLTQSPRKSPIKKKRNASPRLQFSDVVSAVLDTDDEEESTEDDSNSESMQNSSDESEPEPDNNFKVALESLRAAREEKIQLSLEKKQKSRENQKGDRKSKAMKNILGRETRTEELKKGFDGESSDSIIIISEDDHIKDMSSPCKKSTKNKMNPVVLIKSDSNCHGMLTTPVKEPDNQSDSGPLSLTRTPETYSKKKSKMQRLQMQLESDFSEKLLTKKSRKRKAAVDLDFDMLLERNQTQPKKRRKMRKNTSGKLSRKKYESDSDSYLSGTERLFPNTSDRTPLREVSDYKTDGRNIDSDSSSGNTSLVKKKNGAALLNDDNSDTDVTPSSLKRKSKVKSYESDESMGCTPLIRKQKKGKVKNYESDESTGDTSLIRKKKKSKNYEFDGSVSNTPLIQKQKKGKNYESDGSTGDTPLIRKQKKGKNYESDGSTGNTPLIRKQKKGKNYESDGSTGDTPLIRKQKKGKNYESAGSTCDTPLIRKQKKGKAVTYESDESNGDTPLMRKKKKDKDKIYESDENEGNTPLIRKTKKCKIDIFEDFKSDTKLKNLNEIQTSDSDSSSEDMPVSCKPENACDTSSDESTPEKLPSCSATKPRRILDISTDNDTPTKRSDVTTNWSSDSEEETPVKGMSGVQMKNAVHTSKDDVVDSDGSEDIPLSRLDKSTEQQNKQLEESSSESDEDEPLSKTKTKIAIKQRRYTNNKKSTSGNEAPHLKQLRKICRASGMFIRNDRELKGCTTDKQKIVRLKELLKDLGMTGKPSMKQAEEVRLKKEAAELSSQNIISKEPGRGKRKVLSKYSRRVTTPKKMPSPRKSVQNPFGGLKGIVDSEGSGSDSD